MTEWRPLRSTEFRARASTPEGLRGTSLCSVDGQRPLVTGGTHGCARLAGDPEPPRKGSVGPRPTSGGPASGRRAPKGWWMPLSAGAAAPDDRGAGAAPLDDLRRAAPPEAQPPDRSGPDDATADPLCAAAPQRVGASGHQTAGAHSPRGGKRLDPRWPATKAGWQSPRGAGSGSSTSLWPWMTPRAGPASRCCPMSAP